MTRCCLKISCTRHMVRTLLFSLSDCRLVFARIMASIWARLTVFIRRLRPCLSQLSININRDRTYAQAVSNPTRPTTVPQQTSLQRAVAEAKKQDGQLQPGAQHGHLSTATQLTTISGHTSRALSISTLSGSTGKITSPGSPRAENKPPLMLTNG